jgi:hypothetical protein
LATGVASGQRLYRKDLDIESKQDFETAFSGIRRETKDRIQESNDWCGVHAEVTRVIHRLGYVGVRTQNLFKEMPEESFEESLRAAS